MSSSSESVIYERILNPTAKNKRILRITFVIYLAVDFLLGCAFRYTTSLVTSKSSPTMIGYFSLKCAKISFASRLLMTIFGLSALVYHRPSLWSICGTCCLISYILSFLSELCSLFLMFGRSYIALICVEFVMGILSAIVAIILIILLNYQDLLSSDEDKAKLDFRDSDNMRERNITRSILHLVPGLGLFANLISQWTKMD